MIFKQKQGVIRGWSGVIRNQSGVLRGRSGVVRATSDTAFDINTLDPYLWVQGDNLLNAGSTAAGFLEEVATLAQLATGPNASTAPTQTTASQRGLALPLNDGEGYLYLPGVEDNYASIPHNSDFDITGDFSIEASLVLDTATPANLKLLSKVSDPSNENFWLDWNSSGGLTLFVTTNGAFSGRVSYDSTAPIGYTAGDLAAVRVRFTADNGSNSIAVFEQADDPTDLDGSWSQIGSTVTASPLTVFNSATDLEIGSWRSGSNTAEAAIKRVRLFASTDGTDKRFDWNAANPSDAHNSTSVTAETGHTVTINQTGSNPATLVRHAAVRFDGIDDFYDGTLPNITGGVAFVVATILGQGTGPEILRTGPDPYSPSETIVWFRSVGGSESHLFFDGGVRVSQPSGFSLATKIHEARLSGSDHSYLLNGGSEVTSSTPMTASGTNFWISGQNSAGKIAMDLHALVLLPASISEAEASQVRDYLNNKFNVF